ncbi:hypothetical protein PHLGIDRAFT_339892 [Phlebiopsis gigantea 11061_1 CR5-6]|uniref:Uncharacterized protein n=1 Tax=Phlebiopsis gigantea (strain 11061_1 CR5-6) TaxID=745531 RepID=A0A0C3SD22_PHLG1|nr:hypothetical protein PHLGIDRAFT_339892 [Phlebiopsis gigantea 11061_1 CR5-6]
MPVTCSSKLSSRRVYYSQVDMFLFQFFTASLLPWQESRLRTPLSLRSVNARCRSCIYWWSPAEHSFQYACQILTSVPPHSVLRHNCVALEKTPLRRLSRTLIFFHLTACAYCRTSLVPDRTTFGYWRRSISCPRPANDGHRPRGHTCARNVGAMRRCEDAMRRRALRSATTAKRQ